MPRQGFCWPIAANAEGAICVYVALGQSRFPFDPREGVTHGCDVPIVPSMLANAQVEMWDFDHRVDVMIAAVIDDLDAVAVTVSCVDRMTETYFSSVRWA